jgi:dTDP-4-dehydrorhamnose reductase
LGSGSASETSPLHAEGVMELLVFGADSLVGSHFISQTQHSVHAAGRTDARERGLPVAKFVPVDLTRTEEIARVIGDSPTEAIVNFAAATDVDAVEAERPVGSQSASGNAWKVNALAPESMAVAAHDSGRPFVSLSTDFVFDGREGPYSEDASPSPFSDRVSWYGWTKGEGERRARAAHPGTTILRVAYPYRSRFAGKLDFARSLVARRRAGTLPPMFSDQLLTPTWIPDVSRALEDLLAGPTSGVFHAASPVPTTPWEFASELVRALEGVDPVLPAGSMKDFLQRSHATPRPIRGGLRVDRLPKRGVGLTDWKEGIAVFLREGGGS